MKLQQTLRLSAYRVAYVSGLLAWRARRSMAVGAILRFQAIRPRPAGRFQPLSELTVTPTGLDRALAAMRRWGYRFISLDELPERLASPSRNERFVALTFDGASRDVLVHAAPILRQHRAPFAVYVPTSYPDGRAHLWWPALEQVIATRARIGLFMDDREQRLACETPQQKQETFELIRAWLLSLPSNEAIAVAIDDLCLRYGVNQTALAQRELLSWADIHALASDANVTIGSSTVTAPLFAKMTMVEAEREVRMGQAVLAAALHASPKHFAFPDTGGFPLAARDIAIAERCGFATAVTTEHRALRVEDSERLFALPRLTVDGRLLCRGYLRAMLAGVDDAPWAVAPRVTPPVRDLGAPSM